MASFDNHVDQAKKNLQFLKEINGLSNYYDWQVTVCFYVAVHLVNAHMAKQANLHYRTHQETKNAISPDNKLSMCKWNEDSFDKYVSLEKLSRRARYLCDDSNSDKSELCFLTYDKHVSKGIKRLNDIMVYFNTIHNTNFVSIDIKCPKVSAELKKSLQFFSV